MARGKEENDYQTLNTRLPEGILHNPPSLPTGSGILVVLGGIPGAGKSTLSAYWPEAIVISPDAYRAKAPNSAGEWDQSASQWAFANAHKDTKEALIAGKTVVFDGTAAVQKTRNELIRIARDCHAKVHFVWLRGGMDRALVQNELRNHYDPMRYVPPAVLDRMNNSLEESLPTLAEENFDSVNVVTDASRYVSIPDRTQEKIQFRSEEDRKLVHSWMAGKDPASLVIAAAKDGSLERLLPDVYKQIGFNQNSSYHNLELFEHTMAVLDNIAKLTDDPDLRWAALLHDIGKPSTAWVGPKGFNHYYAKRDYQNGKFVGFANQSHEAQGAKMCVSILQEYGLEPERIRRISNLIRHHMWSDQMKTTKAVQNHIRRVGEENVEDLFTLRIADHNGKKDRPKKLPITDAGVERVRKLMDAAKEETVQKAPSPKLALGGGELAKILHVKTGPKVGELVRHLQSEVKAGKLPNERKELIASGRQYLSTSE